MRARFFGHVFGIFLVTVAIATAAGSYFAAFALDRSAQTRAEEALRSPARWAAIHIDQSGTLEDPEALQALCDDMFEGTPIRLTVIDGEGTVIADTDANLATLDNHRFRPEVVNAFGGSIGTSRRFSDTLQQYRNYVAVPVRRDGDVRYVIRSSVAATPGAGQAYATIALVVGIAAFFGATACYLSLGPILASLQEIKTGAEELARGSGKGKLPHRRFQLK